MNTTEQLKIIEQNHLGHFAFLPKELGFDVRTIHGVAVINCGLQSSMFNIAYGAPTNCQYFEGIKQIKEAFEGQPFAWWIPPSEHKVEVTKAFLDNGLTIETIEHAMIGEVANVPLLKQKTDLRIKPVINKESLQDFMSVLHPYDNSVPNFYKLLSDKQLQLQERLFIGYEEDKPVTIGILFILGNAAGIFSLLTSNEVRGKGYGTDMMGRLINIAKEKGCEFVTLSASSDSGYRIYERLGFRKIGEFECFEYNGSN